MSLDLIRKKSPLSLNHFPDTVKPITEGLYLMPEMNFTCPGFINSILIGARFDTVTNNNLNPKLQIWRKFIKLPDGDAKRDTSLTQYTSVTLMSSHVIDISENYFSPTGYSYYHFDKPIEVNAGDFIGFYQPSNSTIASVFYTTETYITPQIVYTNTMFNGSTSNDNISLSLTEFETMDNFYLLLRPQTGQLVRCCLSIMFSCVASIDYNSCLFTQTRELTMHERIFGLWRS